MMSKGKAKEEVVAAASKYRGVMIPPRTGAPPPQDAAWLEAYDKAIRTPSPQKLDSLGTILDGLQDGRYNSAPAPNSLPRMQARTHGRLHKSRQFVRATRFHHGPWRSGRARW